MSRSFILTIASLLCSCPGLRSSGGWDYNKPEPITAPMMAPITVSLIGMPAPIPARHEYTCMAVQGCVIRVPDDSPDGFAYPWFPMGTIFSKDADFPCWGGWRCTNCSKRPFHKPNGGNCWQ